ncbi:MAG TPA: ATP-binding protein [Dongiaceae bacterium]|nr:ATP-binding protein [Dongiaceae bacterium]
MNSGIGSHDVSIPVDGRSAAVDVGILMIGQHSSNLGDFENIRGTGDQGGGLRKIDPRTVSEILLENIQLHQELRRLRTSEVHPDGVASMGDQAASLAHEIKQPIAAAALDARVCLRWLRHDPPDLQQAREAATRVVSDAHRAADIVDRVRSLCRMGTFKREPVDANDVIRGIVPLLHDLSAQNSVSVHTGLDPELPMVSADFVQLQQVLINLMTNGIEAMHDTGGELTVTSRTTEEGEIVIAVSDTGIGLPAGEIDQIFEAFFTTKTEGTGLGLSISRAIVELHGGRLWAGTNAGRGATFQFTLPVD